MTVQHRVVTEIEPDPDVKGAVDQPVLKTDHGEMLAKDGERRSPVRCEDGEVVAADIELPPVHPARPTRGPFDPLEDDVVRSPSWQTVQILGQDQHLPLRLGVLERDHPTKGARPPQVFVPDNKGTEGPHEEDGDGIHELM